MLKRFGKFSGCESGAKKSETASWPDPKQQWTVIVPFHNESAYLPSCLESLAAQSPRPRLILVDNESTDNSAGAARLACDKLGFEAIHLFEGRPGKVAALQCGMREVTTEFVATCDADTVYPDNYLAVATKLFARSNAVAAIAATSPIDATGFPVGIAGLRLKLTAALLKQQCLNGGAGQVFRASALLSCGGFDPAIWNWVLEDHEVMARIETQGKIAYHRAFHCHPADRRRETDCTGWKLAEQLRYHLTSSGERVSFFHEYLAPRLRQRALPSEKLRRIVAIPAVA